MAEPVDERPAATALPVGRAQGPEERRRRVGRRRRVEHGGAEPVEAGVAAREQRLVVGGAASPVRRHVCSIGEQDLEGRADAVSSDDAIDDEAIFGPREGQRR